MPENLVVGVIALVAGLLVGFVIALMVRRTIALSSETAARATADRLLGEARTKQKEIILEA
jgi:Na+-translocating ferredoxin:NAD+ oxidoreductase RnfG subunit